MKLNKIFSTVFGTDFQNKKIGLETKLKYFY